MRYALSIFAVVLGLARTGPAYATPSARLVYSRARGAESCPDEGALRAAVAARVGYDPFFPWAKQTVVASVMPAPSGGFAATVTLVDEEGVGRGGHTLAIDGECRELIDATALAIAIAIDPHALDPRPRTPAPQPVEAPVEAPPIRIPPLALAEPDALPPPAAADPVAFEGTAAFAVAAGLAPSPAIGGALGVAARLTHASIGVEGRMDATASAPAQRGGRVSSELWIAGVLACAHARRVLLCGLGQIGRQGASSEGVPVPELKSALWLGAGGRVGVEVPVQPVLGLRVQTDVVGNLQRHTFVLNGLPAWSPPAVSASLAIEGVVHFQ
jgi:hypothetical protein